MPFWTRRKIHPFGIDLSGDAVRVLQLEQTAGGLTIVAAARRSLDVSLTGQERAQATAQTVRRLLKQEGFVGRAGVVALCDQILEVRTIRIPIDSVNSHANPADIPEVRRSFDFDLSEATPRLLEAGEIHRGNLRFRETIAFAARNEDVETWLSAWRRAGVRVGALEVRPCALYRALHRADPASIAPVALLEIGTTRSNLIIGNGATISFLKAISIGSEQLNDAVSRKLGITASDALQLRRRLIASASPRGDETPDAVRMAVFDATRGPLETLAGEVTSCLRYHAVTFRGEPPAILRLCGVDSTDPQIRHVLSLGVSIQVESLDPLSGINADTMKSADRDGIAGEWAGALGLAIKGWDVGEIQNPSTAQIRSEAQVSSHAPAAVASGSSIPAIKAA